MARSTQNTVPPRHIIAGVFVFIGLFGMCFGLGSQSQGLLVTGAVVMVLAFSVRLFNSLRRTPRQWILGSGVVVEVSEPPADARYGRCDLQLVVDAPGISSETMQVREARAPVAQWPFVGLELPIEIAADDPSNVRIPWRQVPTRVAAYDEEPGGWDDYWPPEPDGPEPAAPEPEPFVDFDLDNPPAAGAAGLPPDLDAAVPGPADPPAAEAAAEAPEAEGAAVPRPRPSPRPRQRPVRTPPVTAPPAGAPPAGPPPAGPPPAGAPPAPPTTAEPAREPEPAMAGAAAATGAGRRGSLVDDLVTTYPSAHPGPAGAINGVGITVLVAELARSIEFYRDQLGFYEVDGGEGSTVLASGETRLVLRATPDLGAVTRRSVYLNLEVADIDAVYAELRASGVRFTYAPRPVNRSTRLELWAAAFRDPDGHGIALTQWRPAEAS